MPKIIVLGKDGMLGRYIYSYLKSNEINVIGTTRENLDAGDETFFIYKWFNDHCDPGDVIVNCIGIIKQKAATNFAMVAVNSLFPLLVENICIHKNIKFIHITTDCVFSGKKGNYNEYDEHDCIDVYGKSKSLGEPNTATVIRTSIIGEEKDTNYSLLSWFLNNDKTILGYTNHLWNGVTCLELAKLIDYIIRNNAFWEGVRHIYSDPISKYELLKMIAKIYKKDINIIPDNTATPIDRTLTSAYTDVLRPSNNLFNQITDQLIYHKML